MPTTWHLVAEGGLGKRVHLQGHHHLDVILSRVNFVHLRLWEKGTFNHQHNRWRTDWRTDQCTFRVQWTDQHKGAADRLADWPEDPLAVQPVNIPTSSPLPNFGTGADVNKQRLLGYQAFQMRTRSQTGLLHFLHLSSGLQIDHFHFRIVC